MQHAGRGGRAGTGRVGTEVGLGHHCIPLSERPAGMAARWRGHRLQGFDILAVFPDRLN